MTEQSDVIGRTLFLTVTVATASSSTVNSQATDSIDIPYDGYLTYVDITSSDTGNNLRYAINRNGEYIYPINDYARRPTSGDDRTQINAKVSEGDIITFIVFNSSQSSGFTITAKLGLVSRIEMLKEMAPDQAMTQERVPSEISPFAPPGLPKQIQFRTPTPQISSKIPMMLKPQIQYVPIPQYIPVPMQQLASPPALISSVTESSNKIELIHVIAIVGLVLMAILVGAYLTKR